MRYYYDFEFIERGAEVPIAPISIGVVDDTGREYYAIFDDAPWDRIIMHPWLRENVVTKLPGDPPKSTGSSSRHPWVWNRDRDSPLYKPGRLIRNELREFFLAPNEPPYELWGYYPAYDHVILMQLFGTMMDRPTQLPMKTKCVEDFAEFLEIDGFLLPPQPEDAHHALEDARWTKRAWEFCEAQRLHGGDSRDRLSPQ